jgi:hypothetical protein
VTSTVAIDEQATSAKDPQSIFNQSAMRVVEDGVVAGATKGEWIYLFDMPEGSSMRTMAIAIAAPESSFERSVEAASPVVDSVEFQAPW